MTAATLDAFLNSYAGRRGRAPRGGRRDRPSARRGRGQGPPHDQPGRARRRLRRNARHQCRRRQPEGPRRLRRRHLPRRHARTRRSRSTPPRSWSSRCCSTADAPLARRHRSARRLLQHRHQHVDRHDLLASSLQLARRTPIRPPLFCRPGTNQLAAGFFIYGPQLALVLSLGSGTHVFVFSTRLGAFVQAHESRIDPARARRNSPSTPPTTGIGTRRSGSMSTTA